MYVISQINILTSPFVFLGLIGWNRSIFTWWKSGITCSRQFEWVFVPSIERFPTPRCILHWPEWNAAHGLAAGLERRLNVGNILIAIIVITYKVTTFTTSIFFWVWICGRVQEIVFFLEMAFFYRFFVGGFPRLAKPAWVLPGGIYRSLRTPFRQRGWGFLS